MKIPISKLLSEPPEVSPADRLWRTLVRVTGGTDTYLEVVMYGWEPTKVIRIPIHFVPQHIRDIACKGKRLHVRVNLNAEKLEDFRYKDWETT